MVENQKGTFVHLRWLEEGIPVEITVHTWEQRGEVMISSVTGKAMKRADLEGVRKIVERQAAGHPTSDSAPLSPPFVKPQTP